VADSWRVHRRMGASGPWRAREPPGRKQVEHRRPVIGPLRPFIDAILEADSERAAASSGTRRIGSTTDQNRTTEYPVAEVTVRQYVRERKTGAGLSLRTTCIPQSYAAGQEGQVDWYEAWARTRRRAGQAAGVSLRSMVSGAAFHRAYQRATQQAFLEAHEHAFHLFCGVLRLLRYDNLKSA